MQPPLPRFSHYLSSPIYFRSVSPRATTCIWILLGESELCAGQEAKCRFLLCVYKTCSHIHLHKGETFPAVCLHGCTPASPRNQHVLGDAGFSPLFPCCLLSVFALRKFRGWMDLGVMLKWSRRDGCLDGWILVGESDSGGFLVHRTNLVWAGTRNYQTASPGRPQQLQYVPNITCIKSVQKPTPISWHGLTALRTTMPTLKGFKILLC